MSLSSLSVSLISTIGLTLVIAFVLLASNFTTINAQEQLTTQTGEIEDGTTTTAGAADVTMFQSTDDSFSVQIPDGWVVHDVDNTGPRLLEETRHGYGLLAQLCPQEEEQQQGASVVSNASGGTNNSTNFSTSSSCQTAQDVIHIIRYPDSDNRLVVDNTTKKNNMPTTNDIVSYHLQKLQEVGYRGIEIVSSIDTTINVTSTVSNNAVGAVPAKLVEMTYSKDSAPGQASKGYFLSSATAATSPNPWTTKGYSVFYEGNSPVEDVTIASGSLQLLPPVAGEVFDSFKLILAPELESLLVTTVSDTNATELAEETADGDVDDDEGEDEDGGDDEGEDEDGGDGEGEDEDGGDDEGEDEDGGDDEGEDEDGGDDEGEDEDGD
jgi:hypothetical protein